jgi:hypothetical protein
LPNFAVASKCRPRAASVAGGERKHEKYQSVPATSGRFIAYCETESTPPSFQLDDAGVASRQSIGRTVRVVGNVVNAHGGEHGSFATVKSKYRRIVQLAREALRIIAFSYTYIGESR